MLKDLDGKTAFEKEIEYFGARMREYPGRNVIYRGKPLMLIYLGAAQDPNPSDNPLWFQIRTFLNHHREIESKYTFRMVAGYLDSQPDLRATQGTPDGPVKINPEYGFWSWVGLARRISRGGCDAAVPGCARGRSIGQAS